MLFSGIFALARGGTAGSVPPPARARRARERRRGDSGEGGKRGAKVRSSDCGGSWNEKASQSPFPSRSLARVHHPTNAAYLVLGLGSQPLEERVALKGAGRARLVLVSHRFLSRFFFFQFASIPFFFFVARKRGGATLASRCCCSPAVACAASSACVSLSRDARESGWLLLFHE